MEILSNPATRTVMQSIMLQAMDAAGDGITISDALHPDQPLIYVNKGFTSMTGYTAEESIGKNCRFLQGLETDRQIVAGIRRALTNGEPIRVELLNYHKSGYPFWNRLSITPVFDVLGQLTHFIGVQDDVTGEKQKITLEKKTAEQELTLKVGLEVQEKERQELGKELHDNINQMIATANLYLGVATDQEAERVSMIGETRTLLRKTSEEIRRLSQSLVGPALHQATLRDSVSTLLNGLKPAMPFTLAFAYEGINEVELSEARRVMFYRIIQEQVNNILKHAHATEVSVRFENLNGAVVLTIKDNGVGFNDDASRKGIGMQNIRARLRLEGGHLALRTAPGEGCELTAILPLR